MAGILQSVLASAGKPFRGNKPVASWGLSKAYLNQGPPINERSPRALDGREYLVETLKGFDPTSFKGIAALASLAALGPKAQPHSASGLNRAAQEIAREQPPLPRLPAGDPFQLDPWMGRYIPGTANRQLSKLQNRFLEQLRFDPVRQRYTLDQFAEGKAPPLMPRRIKNEDPDLNEAMMSRMGWTSGVPGFDLSTILNQRFPGAGDALYFGNRADRPGGSDADEIWNALRRNPEHLTTDLERQAMLNALNRALYNVNPHRMGGMQN